MHHRPQPYASYPPQPNAHQASTLCITGPSVNVHRVARNGRNFEYLSGEDPYLGGQPDLNPYPNPNPNPNPDLGPNQARSSCRRMCRACRGRA